MKSPFTGKEMNIVKEWRKIIFRKEEFNVLFHFYKCMETGEQFEDEKFAELNYNQLVNQYRVKNNIPFPEQIISIRKKYNLSASKISEVLGFGTNVYRQYENGEVPNHSNAKLIQLANDPREFRKLVELCSTLNDKSIQKMKLTIDDLLEEEKNYKPEKQLINYFLGNCSPNNLTGFKNPNMKKFSEMVIFFTEQLQPWKTKLNKLLFYSDFTMFKNTGFSISGIKYQAIKLGPVPNNFQSLFEFMANKNVINIVYKNFEDGGTGEQFLPFPNNEFDSKLFTQIELEILNKVVEKFRNTSTNEIIEISHKEKAWLKNQEEKKLIDYSYSFDLN